MLDTVRVPLTNGQFAVVDAADFDLVRGHVWTAIKRGHVTHACTRIRVSDEGRNGGWKTFYMHQFITGVFDRTIDHRDHDGLNNRRDNLRPATQRQNSYNQRAVKREGKKSRFKGVTRSDWNPNPKWVAVIAPNGKRINLGSFEAEEDAARAYDRAAIKHFGEFAHLNFPEVVS